MNRDVELVYFSGCPNVEDARDNLRTALTRLGLDPRWREWDLGDSEAPERVRGFASPSVLVGGVHVCGDQPLESGANACSASGAPAPSVIIAALEWD